VSSPDSTVELTAEQFARLDANRRQVGALTSRLHQAKIRAKVAEQIVEDARALVATIPHGSCPAITFRYASSPTPVCSR